MIFRRLYDYLWIILLPLSIVWAGTMWLRRRLCGQKPYRSKIPIICVGNLHSGGSGKTPLVLAISEKFTSRNPAILSRGYGGSAAKSSKVVDRGAPNGSVCYGDEPWMMANLSSFSIFVGKNRVASIQGIEKTASTLAVLDDGFQYLKLAKDVHLVAINVERSIKEDSYCLPWGELREPWSSLRYASAVVLTGARDSGCWREWEEFVKESSGEIPVFKAYLSQVGLWQGTEGYQRPDGESMIGFCGIADSKNFTQSLAALKSVTFVKAFRDHHSYNVTDVKWLIEKAQELKATALVTTDKDYFKTQHLFERMGARLVSLRIRYDIDENFWYFLKERIERH
ncbi:MAG: tetraacyldisaccharide 4'-kinase [Deltaproteobacteria bacterium]|nr:tetraacyldisaccharide 4'-kinase [Deltaproteobacteria bacterium]